MRALSLSLALLCLTAHSCAQGWRVGGAGASTDAPEAPTVAAIALAIKSRAIQDSRCYLMNGGAVESFFISEDTPVGSVIGTLSVNGDPSSEHGDITLKLQEKNAAVGIAPGTKNLTLLRTLDREEKLGPSNVYVNVRCDRRRTTDPSFIIPVSVRVWDVNDNAPQWVGAPYAAQLSELAARGARVPVSARATDHDQPGPHATIHYRVLPGPNSEYITFPNELDSTLVVDKPLDYETLRNLTVTLRAQDGGDPPLHSDTTLTLTVLDADDQNPKFTHEHYTAVVPEDAKEGTVLSTSPGPISARDQDVGISAPLQYSAGGAGGTGGTGGAGGAGGTGGQYVRVHADTGAVSATQLLIDELRQPITVVIKATQIDNSDRYALATLTLSRASEALKVSGVRFRRRHYSSNVSESAAPGNVILTLHTTPSQKNLQFYVSDRSFLDKFAINSAGEVVLRRSLDYESTDLYQYQVMVTDGTSNDTASIDIIVMNVNEWEPRFRHPQYEFRVHERDVLRALRDGGTLPVGVMHVFDGDAGDMVTLSLRGEGADMFHVNSSGALWLSAAQLNTVNSSALHLVVTAQDSGDPPRQTSVPVTVHLPTAARQSTGAAPLLGAALGALAILVCALAVYIYAVRRRSKRATSPSSSGYVTHEKSAGEPPGDVTRAGGAGAGRAGAGGTGRAGGTGGTGGAGGTGALRGALSSGSLLSVSAGASTILADSNSSIDTSHELPHLHTNGTSASRQSQRTSRSAAAPAPAAAAAAASAAAAAASAAAAAAAAASPAQMSDHLCGAAGRSGVAWPSATIPARVKKLSWDDTEHSPEGSGRELTDATNPALAEHLNLTVYF